MSDNNSEVNHSLEEEQNRIKEQGVKKYIEELINDILSGKYTRMNIFSKNNKYLGISPDVYNYVLDYLEKENASDINKLMFLRNGFTKCKSSIS